MYESRGTTKTFAKVPRLRYIESKDVFYEEPSLEAQDELSSSRRCPVRSDDAEKSANVATIVWESRVDDTPGEDDDCDSVVLLALAEVVSVEI